MVEANAVKEGGMRKLVLRRMLVELELPLTEDEHLGRRLIFRALGNNQEAVETFQKDFVHKISKEFMAAAESSESSPSCSESEFSLPSLPPLLNDILFSSSKQTPTDQRIKDKREQELKEII